MYSFFTRSSNSATRSASNRMSQAMQKRFMGGAETPEEAQAGMGLWKKASIICTVPVLAWAGITFFHEEHLSEHKPYPHMHIRTKRFPWSDGERELFALAGNKIGHYYPQYDVEQPGSKKHH